MGLYLSGNWREERARMVLDASFPPAAVDPVSVWKFVRAEASPVRKILSLMNRLVLP